MNSVFQPWQLLLIILAGRTTSVVLGSLPDYFASAIIGAPTRCQPWRCKLFVAELARIRAETVFLADII